MLTSAFNKVTMCPEDFLSFLYLVLTWSQKTLKK